jgi:hypothetical protein
MFRRERQQGDLARPLQSGGQHALMARAGTGLASRLDLASVGDVAAQTAGLLVVDRGYFVDTKGADPAPPETAATATASRPLLPGAGLLPFARGLAAYFF